MSIDLFLVAKPKPRSKSAAQKARQALFDALRADYPDTSLVGDVTQGHIANFPLGELHIRPDELHWALHGMEDADPVHALADWFFAQGFACDDPQGAGFARPRPKPVAIKGSLADLVGSQWLGFRFDRNYATAIDIDFEDADGRRATVRLLYFDSAHVPDLAPLVKAVVSDATLELVERKQILTVRFDGGYELAFGDAVFDGVRIAAG